MISYPMMNQLKPLLLIIGILLSSCNDTDSRGKGEIIVIPELDGTIADSTLSLNDFREIERLIRDVYTWHDNENPTNIRMLSDPRDSMYIGYNLRDLDLATNDLEKSNFFTEEFIDNYASIHRAVDKKLKKKEIEWLHGSLPNFGSDAEPWCYCQDVPYDAPNPWSKIEITTINATGSEGEFYWKWGGLGTNTASGWYNHTYHFKAKKVDRKWKVSYLEGLNLNDFTRKNW